MADLTVISYHRDGDNGLEAWPDFALDTIASGTLKQTGHTYLDNGVFTSGVWECTSGELIPGDYDVDEMMIVLDGAITIEHESGASQTFTAGQAFVIPKGTPCQWIQTETTRKFWAIYDSPGELNSDFELEAMLLDPEAKMPSMGAQDPTVFESAPPEMGMLILHKDPTGKFIAGLWESTPMTRKPGIIERSELMHILKGSGSITNADGVVFNFKAGDTFMVPVGMGYQWESHEYVKKIFCSFTP